MGFRLDGPRARRIARGADIISDATPLGVLQVPASGQPILLMADRQTTGGYPKIATVITADLGVAGQLAPGDAIAFAVCTPRDALAALIAQERALMALESGGRERLRRGAARRRSAPIACAPSAPLAPLTTFRVGGPADWLLETRSSDEIVAALSTRARRPACR